VRGAGDAALALDEVAYRTAATDERFLQWVTPEGKIAGFLRLSLPHADALASRPGVPVAPGEAMIREVHVYGTVARIGDGTANGAAQHRGLGKQLVARACAIARDAGYHAIKVISAVGTRGYYRGLGFHDEGLYQRKEL
jgi:elongator complex protein 3